jgi:hypothetical protein
MQRSDSPSLVPRLQNAAKQSDPSRASGASPRLADSGGIGLDAWLADHFAGLAEDLASRVVELLGEREPEPLLDRRGLAAMLACSIDTIDKITREGCPHVLVGDARRYERDAVLEWLRARGTT